MAEKSTFSVLNAINCNEHTEKKNGLTYLSWAWAWQIAKTNFPDATYDIYENAEGLNYHHDGRTCWVKTGVTIGGIEHIEYLPVMDHRNASIPRDKVTSFDVNKAIQRSLTKALARHGLGLYIYAGEDLPDAEDDTRREITNAQMQRKVEKVGSAMTKEEFKKRWDSDESGGGITYDDIAECAIAWGICSKPRIHPIDLVRDKVLAAANCYLPGEGPTEEQKAVDRALLPGGERFAKAVEAHAKGEAAGGRTYREIWARAIKATPDQLGAFDEAVEQYKINNNL